MYGFHKVVGVDSGGLKVKYLNSLKIDNIAGKHSIILLKYVS